MKKYIAVASLILLSGCATGGASQYQLNSAMQKANKEAANCGSQAMPSDVNLAWEKVNKAGKEQCRTDESSLPPSQALKRDSCMAELTRQYVKPVTAKPKKLEKFLAQTKELSTAYQNGEIDRDTVNNQIMQKWHEYATSEISYYQMAQCQNAALMKHMMPVYHNKAILSDLMTKKLEVAMKVDQGKLTPQQADLEAQKDLAKFATLEQNANAALQAKNEQEWREYSKRLQQYSQQLNQQNATQAQQCGSLSIPPIASVGCKNICINGNWAKVCG